MGNFSVSHFSGIRLSANIIEIRYILDMAEIPTFQELQATGIATDPDDPRVTAYLAQKADTVKSELGLSINGRPVSLQTISEDVIFPPGAGGLPTMKIGFVYRAALPDSACVAATCALEYRDRNLPDRAGWKEVVATAAPGIMLRSSTVPASSRSQELANYPTDLVDSPPQILSARLTFEGDASTAALPMDGHVDSSVGGTASNASGNPPRTPDSAANSAENSKPSAGIVGPATSAQSSSAVALARSGSCPPGRVVESDSGAGLTAPHSARSQPAALGLKINAQKTPRNRFTELIASNQWGLWFLLTAALIAAALGGLHALEPGHGKTIVAAYLVGSQGTAVHALWLGLVVTTTHTAGVYALGLITLYASKYIVPDHLYPWLGVTSGLAIAALGLYMLRRRYADHSQRYPHQHGEHHHHHGWFAHSHTHEHTDDHEVRPGHHHDHPHHHHREHQHHVHHPLRREARSFSYRQLVTLGVTGGIVPCPAALVVLLSAVSLHRVAFGLYLILAFSLGLAAVLIAIGLLAVYARRLMARIPTEGALINRWLPMASAAVVTCLGAAIVFQGLISMTAIRFRP
jgi:ABC-type nickel/cobalt efflux system permease component RcnA